MIGDRWPCEYRALGAFGASTSELMIDVTVGMPLDTLTNDDTAWRVRKIMPRAFEQLTDTTVDLSKCVNLTHIGEYAFCNLRTVPDLSQLNQLVDIGKGAFENATEAIVHSFTDDWVLLTAPSLRTIGARAFANLIGRVPANVTCAPDSFREYRKQSTIEPTVPGSPLTPPRTPRDQHLGPPTPQTPVDPPSPSLNPS